MRRRALASQSGAVLIVGAPSYFRTRSEPRKPQELIGHNCINLRLTIVSAHKSMGL